MTRHSLSRRERRRLRRHFEQLHLDRQPPVRPERWLPAEQPPTELVRVWNTYGRWRAPA